MRSSWCECTKFVGVSVFRAAWKLVNCDSTRMSSIVLWIGVIQRVWPRMSQSLNIFVANYQIVSSIPIMSGIKFPEPFTTISDSIGDVISGAVELLPSIACTAGGSFGRRLLFKVMMPVVLLIVIFIVHRCRIWHLVHNKMPIDETVMNTLRAKLARALVRSHYVHTSGSWAFAVIYITYPSTSAAIMETFYCRKVSETGMRVLLSDHSVVCMNGQGVIEPAYLVYLIVGILLTLAWSIGVPAYFGWRLYSHRDTIKSGNIMYAGIAPFRPLFMFFKQDCYMFEVYFMVEKLLLAGVIGILRVYIGGFFLVTTCSMLVTTFMLCLIVKNRPSKVRQNTCHHFSLPFLVAPVPEKRPTAKTPAYNTANVISHAIMLVTIFTTIAMKFPQPEDAWMTPEVLGLSLSLGQVPFWLYLIKVSFSNFKKMWRTSRVEAKASIERKKNLSSSKRRARPGTLEVTVAQACGLPISGKGADSDGYAYYCVVQAAGKKCVTHVSGNAASDEDVSGLAEVEWALNREHSAEFDRLTRSTSVRVLTWVAQLPPQPFQSHHADTLGFAGADQALRPRSVRRAAG